MAAEDNQAEPQQIEIMRQMLALAEKQTQLSLDRSELSKGRSAMSKDRSRMSAERSQMSADRSEMSAQRSYHNAERTLSVWVRTALSLMVLGIAMSRFGLLLHNVPGGQEVARLQASGLLDILSNWCGAGLVVFGTFMAAVTGLRFLAYARYWRRYHQLPRYHGPWLASFFALMTALFGVVLLVVLLVFMR